MPVLYFDLLFFFLAGFFAGFIFDLGLPLTLGVRAFAPGFSFFSHNEFDTGFVRLSHSLDCYLFHGKYYGVFKLRQI